MRLLKQVLIAGLLAGGLICIPAGAWESGRGDAGGSACLRYDGGGAIDEWHFVARTQQRYKPGLAIWASPALALVNQRPVAFIGGYDQTLHALDLLDKRELWSKVTNAEIGSAPAVGDVDGQPVVFFGSNDRTVYALTALTGTTLWTRELVPPAPSLGDATLSAPLLHAGRLYITCFAYDRSLARNDQRGWLICLDARTGAEQWRQEVSQGFVGDPAGYAGPDGRFYVVVAARKGLVQCWDVSGVRPAPAWRFQMPHEVLGAPVIDTRGPEPLVLLGSKFGNLVAIDARTGRERWQRMAGNWIDNAACLGRVNGTNVVLAGSYDYFVYAFESATGRTLWKTPVGGEIYSAPAFGEIDGRPVVVVAALDNHVYLLDAAAGRVLTSFFTGQPLWDKISKGETVWGSPALVQAGDQSAVVCGSFQQTVYVLPLVRECSLQAQARSARSLWVSLGVTALVFLFVVLPLAVRLSADAIEP